jgi:hypothetical protein
LPGDGPKVVFIAGWGRSGSTLLERILAEVPAFVTVGELFQLWGEVDQRVCACGRPLNQCPWWIEVLEHAFGRRWPTTVRDLGKLRKRSVRHRYVPALLGLRPLPPTVEQGLERYREAVTAVHRSAAHIEGARAVVDASKSPIDALVMTASTADIRFVHLTRDPRGVAASWKRERPRLGHSGGVGRMARHSAARSAAEWTARNALVDVALRHGDAPHVRVGYRDLVTYPAASLQRVLGLLGEPDAPLDFVHDREVDLTMHHAVGGNPGRTRTGTIELAVDDGWRTELTRTERYVVTALAAPMWWRYVGC